MSLLSSTQGTPERVWSTLAVAAALGGQATRVEMQGWLNPRFTEQGARRPAGGEADLQAIACAVSLGLLGREDGNYTLRGTPLPDYATFADAVHDTLCGVPDDDADAVLLEVFAWMLTEVDARQSTGWISGSRDAFADDAEAAIGGAPGPQGERRFNSTKLSPWRRWIAFLGLAVDLPHNLGFQPYLSERLARELWRSGLPRDAEVPARDVLRVAADRMPYVDGGSLHRRALSRRGAAPPRRVSRLLSVALRDLHDEGVLQLRVTGDATGLTELAPDVHPIRTVQTIVLKEPTDA